jgi:hypothetical protein
MKHAICLQNKSFEVSLEKQKVYRVISDKTAASHHLVRVGDESKQSYLYPPTFLQRDRYQQNGLT